MPAVKRRLQIFLLLFVLITALGSISFMALENISFTEALYFNIVTMSTVGYGDIHPTQNATRILSIFLIVLGGGTFLGVIANTTELLLLKRENRMRARKINMVLGVFFSEAGNFLLSRLSVLDPSLKNAEPHFLMIAPDWKQKDFARSQSRLQQKKSRLIVNRETLADLADYLSTRRTLFISLMENPAIVEHEYFSETLLAVFHLAEELSSRPSFLSLPESDLAHLTGDVNRAYGYLVNQWLGYMEHLSREYPYLYSLAVRRNPFNTSASAIVK